MSDATFVCQINGSSYSNLVDVPISFEANVRNFVSLLKKPEYSTICLSRLPDGQTIYDVTVNSLPTAFLQAAGTADAMTVEWRRLDDDGVERLYTVGRGGVRGGEPDVRIEFYDGAHSAIVYPDEVFDSNEASEIFVHYFHTLTVPEGYVLREFDLTWPKP